MADTPNPRPWEVPFYSPAYDATPPIENGDFEAGVKRGAYGLRSAVSGAVGDTSAADYYSAKAAGTPARFNSFRDIDPLSLDVVDYVQQMAGEQAPNMALLATGGAPGLAAKSVVGARLGAFVPSALTQFGEMSNELRDVGKSPTALTAGLAVGAGLLDIYGLESFGRGVLRSAVGDAIKADAKASTTSRLMRGAMGGFAEGIKNELPAELTQEVLAVGNRVAHDPNYMDNTRDMANRFEETAAATTAFAGPLGGSGGAVGALRSNPPSSAPPPSQTHDMTLEEMRNLPPDLSTVDGENHGEEARKESTYANAIPARQRQEVLNGSGASAPVSNNAAYALEFYKNKGLSHEDASALVANLMAESGTGLNPNAINPTSGAYGIAQHLGDRKDKLLAKGGEGNFEVQLNHVWDELNSSHKGALNALVNAPTLRDKTLAIRKLYEIPGEGEARDNARFDYASQLATGQRAPVTYAETNSGDMGSSLGRYVNQNDQEAIAGQEEASGQKDAVDEPDEFEPTDDGFTLTQKGKKEESTGDDLFSPALEVYDQNPDRLDRVVKESTPTRAFQQIYPTATIEPSAVDARKVSVVFPRDQGDPLSNSEKQVAAATLSAFSSGKAGALQNKILLEHPDIVSAESDKPIETPVTKEGLVKIGRALDPGTYGETSQDDYQAALQGLTHLVYDKGFQPRGVDVNNKATFSNWVAQTIKPPEDSGKYVQERAGNRPGSSADSSLPITALAGLGRSGIAQEVAQHLGIPHIPITAGVKTLSSDRPTGTIELGGATSGLSMDAYNRPVLTVSAKDLTNPRDAGEVIRSFLTENNVRRPLVVGKSPQASKVLKYALSPDVQSVQPPARSTPVTFAQPNTDVAQQMSALRDPSVSLPEMEGQTQQGYQPMPQQAVPIRAGQSSNLGFSTQGFDENAPEANGVVEADTQNPESDDANPIANRVQPEWKESTRRATENSISKVNTSAAIPRDNGEHESIERVHRIDGGATVRASGVSDKVVSFFTSALKNIGLQVPLRVIGQGAIKNHLDALQQRIEILHQRIDEESATLQNLEGMLKKERAAFVASEGVSHKEALAAQKGKVKTLERLRADSLTEQANLIQAFEDQDQFAARVVYNDHYAEQSRRVPIIIVSDQAANNPKLTSVLAHELGHVVQRAWYEQLPSKLKQELLKELTQGGRFEGDVAEAFADRFMDWYQLNAQKKGPLGDVKEALDTQDRRTNNLAKAARQQRAVGRDDSAWNKVFHEFSKLAETLRKLWTNLVKQDKAFRQEYPKFDEFIRSTVGVYGKLQPINPSVNKMWTEGLAQPYGGLPLMRYEGADKFSDMSADELQSKVNDAMKEASERAVLYAKNRAGENTIAKRYIRKSEETLHAMKQVGRMLVVADGAYLRNIGKGILAGYADLVAPIKGRALGSLQVIKPFKAGNLVLETNALHGSIDTLTNMERGKWYPKLSKILAKVGKLSPDEQKALLDNLRDEKVRSKTPLATEIRTYYAQMLQYMRTNGVRVSSRSGYYTKAWDQEKLLDNEAEVIATFEKVFAARQELPTKLNSKGQAVPFDSPLAAAKWEYERLINGTVDNLFDQLEKEESDDPPELRGPSFRYARKRAFSDEEYQKFGLDKYLNDDIASTMLTYTELGIKRAVQQTATGIPKGQLRNQISKHFWSERFTKAKLDPQVMYSPIASLELLLAEGHQDGRLNDEDYREARARIMSTMGLLNVGTNPRARRWMNRLIAYETLLTMGWSAFMQLSDFGISVWRADSMDRVGKTLGALMDKETRENQKKLLKTIGLSLEEITRHAVNVEGLNVDPMAKGTQWLTEKFFKLNGMHAISEANMLFSASLGQSYIEDFVKQAIAGEGTKAGAEAMKRLHELHPYPERIIASWLNGGTFATDPNLQSALHEYVSQSHLHNQTGYTPRIFNDYRWKFFTHLKSFMFKYQNIVLGQVWERMKERPDLLTAAIPVLSLALCTMPLAWAGAEAKDALRRKILPKVKRAPKEKTAMQKFHDAAMASGMPGVYVGLFDSALEAPTHGQPALVSLAGPSVGHAYNIMSRTADEWVPSSIPVIASVPWLRSEARQFTRDTFGWGVRNDDE